MAEIEKRNGRDDGSIGNDTCRKTCETRMGRPLFAAQRK